MPDGVADTYRGSLGNGTVAADVLDQTATTDLVGALLELDAAEPAPSPATEGLAPFGSARPILETLPGVDLAPGREARRDEGS